MTSLSEDEFSILFKTVTPGKSYLEADITSPKGLVVDSEGSIIFLDSFNEKILKINRDGKIITIAGGTTGFKDGKGLSAQFNFPLGITISKDDVIYVSDFRNKAIRRISTEHVVSTIISGNSVGSVFDLAYYNEDNTIYYTTGTIIGRLKSDGSENRLWAGSLVGYEDGIGPLAKFSRAFGISVNQVTGEVFVVEFDNQTIRKIDKSQRVTTVTKNLIYPWGIHIIKNESIIVSEYYGHTIKKYTFKNQKIDTIAGTGGSGLFDGLGTDAVLSLPAYISWNPLSDEIYVSEWANGIRIINKFNYVSTLLMPTGSGLEDGPAHIARTLKYRSMTIDEKTGTLFFTDQLNNCIRKCSISNGTVTTIGGKPYTGNVIGDLKDALFSAPTAITHFNNTLLLVDSGNNMIKRLSLTNNSIHDFLESERPWLISMDQSKKSFYVSKITTGAFISQYDMDRNFIKNLNNDYVGCKDGHYTTASVKDIKDIYAMADGTTYLSDSVCLTIRVFDPKTESITVLAGKSEQSGFANGVGNKATFGEIYGLDYYAADKAFFIADFSNNMIRKMTLNGNVTTYAGLIEGGYRNGPIEIALFLGPKSLRVTSGGDIILSDDGNFAIRIIRKTGTVETLLGYGSQKYRQDPGANVELNNPISITGKGDKIFILNKEDNNIIGYNLQGTKFLFAGNGAIGWSDGDSLQAMFNRPEGISYSSFLDSILVADTKNQLIRLVSMTGSVSTFAGTGDVGLKNEMTLSSKFNSPTSITSDNDGNVFVADSGNNAIRKITISTKKVITYAGGSPYSDFMDGRLLSARFNVPSSVYYNPVTGNIVVADMYNHAIRSINATHVTTLAGNGTSGYNDGPYSQALFSYPRTISVNNDGVIYVADTFNDRIRRLSNGLASTVSRDKLRNPSGLFESNGILYVSEYSNNLIKKISVQKPFFSSSTVKLDNNELRDTTIAASIIIIILGVSLSLAFWWRQNRKNGLVTKKLKQIQNSPNPIKSKNAAEKTGTVTLNQPLAFAIPGYLAINLSKAIRIAEFAGSGGTANICIGSLRDPKLIKRHNFIDVAIKFVNETTNVEDFFYEITVMNSFPKSINIVELVGYSSNPRAIIMKSYPSSLTNLITSKETKSLDLKLKISLDIAKGMEIIHKCGVIHFDLKPANILLHFVENALTAAVCDFGFASLTADYKSFIVKGVKSPKTNGVTARYAAPEQFQASKDFQLIASQDSTLIRLDDEIYKKVDIFSYAMTIYYIFSESRPWNNENNLQQIENKVCAGERPEVPQSVETEIRNLMEQCWAHNPVDRPSFTEIITKLKK